MTTSDLRWMRLALAQAEQGAHAKWRVGAAIVRGGSVVGKGFNRYRNNPAFVDHSGVSYHAEAVAVRRAGENVAGATIYVARVTGSGNLGLAKPCERCQELLWDCGIHTVVWTSSRGVQKSRLSELLEFPEEPRFDWPADDLIWSDPSKGLTVTVK